MTLCQQLASRRGLFLCKIAFPDFLDMYFLEIDAFCSLLGSQAGQVVHWRDPRIQSTCPGEGKNICPRGPKLQPTNYNWQIANSKMKYEDARCKCHVNETSKLQRACTCRWKLEDAIVDGTFIPSFAAWWPLKGPADIWFKSDLSLYDIGV